MKWKLPQINERWKASLQGQQWVFLVVVLGLLLMLWPAGENGEKERLLLEESGFSVEEFETHIAEHLSLVEGAGPTRVVLTLKHSGTAVYAQDVVADSGGKHSTSTVTVGSGSSEAALTVQQTYPAFQGALVICPGGDNPQVQLALTSALAALTGLGSNSISVCKGE